MEIINVQIDISSSTGKRLLREIQKHPKVATIEYPEPEAIAGQQWHTIEDVFSKIENVLNNYYGTNLKLKY